ncbi:hypothetical protein [Falsiroseomonas sp. HW251]|uniref:hypothetical protein n=1 Tax=Falsiroseomonas sp. HW251 TaxID=3390998 RepID=UPI003D31F536
MAPIVEARLIGGRLGNKMFQTMLAHALARRVPGAVVTGDPLPEFGLTPPTLPRPVRHVTMHGHRPDMDRAAALLAGGEVDAVVTWALGCRMEYIEPVGTVRALFPRAAPAIPGYGPDRLLINIRAPYMRRPSDTRVHASYCPLPLAYYERLIAGTGLRPVFLGQIGRDAYSAALRARFPDAEFQPSRGAMVDFETIRASHHVCVAVSTFSWLATWLSDAATIHLPIAGLYHPGLRQDIDLLPVADPRYRFHLFAPRPWGGLPADLAAAVDGTETGEEVSAEAAAALV